MDFDTSRIGWPDAALEYWDAVAPASNYSAAFAYAGFITVCGQIMGRRAWIQYIRKLFPNFYTVLIGDSGAAGKSTAMEHALDAVAGRIQVTDHVISAPGMLQELEAAGGKMLLHLDEFGNMLASSKKQDFAATVLTTLTEMYSNPPVWSHHTRKNPIKINEPMVSIFAGSTINWIQANLTSNDLLAGLGNRFTWVMGDTRPQLAFPPPSNASELDWIRLTVFEGQVDLDEDARDVWEAWFAQFKQAQALRSNFVRTMCERIPEKIMKVALIHRAWENSHIVHGEAMVVAIDFGEYLQDCLAAITPMLEDPERQVLDAILMKGCNTRPKLYDQFSSTLGGRRLTDAIKALTFLGKIQEDASGKIVLPGVRK